MTDLDTFSKIQCSPSDAQAKMSFHLKQKKCYSSKFSWEEKGKKLVLLLFSNSSLELWIVVSRVVTKHKQNQSIAEKKEKS